MTIRTLCNMVFVSAIWLAIGVHWGFLNAIAFFVMFAGGLYSREHDAA